MNEEQAVLDFFAKPENLPLDYPLPSRWTRFAYK